MTQYVDTTSFLAMLCNCDVEGTQEACTPIIFVSETIQGSGDQHHRNCNLIMWLQHSSCLVPTQGDIGSEGQTKLRQRRTQVLASRQSSCRPLI